jgi:hypothetical protein
MIVTSVQKNMWRRSRFSHSLRVRLDIRFDMCGLMKLRHTLTETKANTRPLDTCFFLNTLDLYSRQFFVTIQIFNADWTQKQTKVIRHNLFVQFITHLMPPVKCFNIYCFATRLFLRI